MRAYRKRTYAKQRTSILATVRRRKVRNMRWWKKFKRSLRCAKCGENHPASLEFHHRQAKSKDRALSFMANGGYSRDRIMAEAAKCQVLCANCHRKRHHRR